jgi:hypothetical protein
LLNQSKDAKKILELAISFGGDKNVTILEHYIEVLVTMHQKDAALKAYELILKLGKDSLRVKGLLNIRD